MGAPKGNTNAARGRQWTAAIERALDRRRSGDKRMHALDQLADRFLDEVFNGDLQAFRELGDRLEGKARQAIDLAGDADAPPVSINIVSK